MRHADTADTRCRVILLPFECVEWLYVDNLVDVLGRMNVFSFRSWRVYAFRHRSTVQLVTTALVSTAYCVALRGYLYPEDGEERLDALVLSHRQQQIIPSRLVKDDHDPWNQEHDGKWS